MNFLAHFVLAKPFLPPKASLPFFIVGTALPDLLPLAAERVRLRHSLVEAHSAGNAADTALQAGVLTHLVTDAAFHKTRAFNEASADVNGFLAEAKFDGIRVRRFFLAHVLVELALDAVLLRSDPGIADGFYAAFSAADYADVTHWTECVTSRPLPNLPAVLTRFAQSQYLYHYQQDEGVATGLSRLCKRARQDTFEGENYRRLVEVVRLSMGAVAEQAKRLRGETAEAI